MNLCKRNDLAAQNLYIYINVWLTGVSSQCIDIS